MRPIGTGALAVEDGGEPRTAKRLQEENRLDQRPSSKSQAAAANQSWSARVGAELSSSDGAEPRPDLRGLRELAEEASRAADRSARLAQSAAHAASLAGITAERLGVMPIVEARQAAWDLAESAERAEESANETEDRAALARHAAQSDPNRT